MKKTITIKKNIIRDIIISFLLSYSIVLCLQPLKGKITYLTNVPVRETVTYNSPVYQIYFDTAFGNKLTYSGDGFIVSDINLNISDKSLHIFSNKLPYYFQASFRDFLYVIIFGCLITFIIIFFRNFKFNFS